MKKIFGGGISGMGVLFLISLFMPWVAITCGGRDLGHQKGLGVVFGSEMDMSDAMGDSPMGGLGEGMGGTAAGEAEEEESEVERMSGALFLLIPIFAVGLAALLGFTIMGGAKTAPIAAGLSGVALVVLLIAFFGKLPVDKFVEEQNEEIQAGMAETGDSGMDFNPMAGSVELDTDRRGGFTLALIAAFFQLGLGIGATVVKD